MGCNRPSTSPPIKPQAIRLSRPIQIALVLIVGLALAAALSVERSSQASTLAAAGDDRFGIVFVNAVGSAYQNNTAQRYQLAKDAGAKWTRWPIYWPDVQPHCGEFDWSAVDAVVNDDVANGLKTDAILLGMPGCARVSSTGAPLSQPEDFRPEVGSSLLGPSDVPRQPQATVMSVPQGLYEPVFVGGQINPANRWGYYVFQTVSRYRDRIKHWEMWNEPDLSSFWTGSVADYVRLLKVGYLAAKAADPSASVLFAGLAYWSNPNFLPQALDRLKADGEGAAHGYFFDALPLHFYINPQHIFNFAGWARSTMAQRGLSKPIWVNEANIPVCGDKPYDSKFGCSTPSYLGTLDQQAAYVIQAYALAVAANVQKLFIFQHFDDGNEFLYGLNRNDFTSRPAYRGYQAAATYMTNVKSATRQTSGAIDKVTMYTPLGKVTAIWSYSTSPVKAVLNASTAQATLVDKVGKTSTMNANGSCFVLTLPPASHRDPGSNAIDLGGDPYIIVESGVTAPQTALNALDPAALNHKLRLPIVYNRSLGC